MTDVLVVGVGRQVAEKGIFELAGAARRLRAAGHLGVRFIWVGPPDDAKPDAVIATGAPDHPGSASSSPALNTSSGMTASAGVAPPW